MTNESNSSSQVCLSEPMSFRVTCRSMGEPTAALSPQCLFQHRPGLKKVASLRLCLGNFLSPAIIASCKTMGEVPYVPYKFQELPSISELYLLSGT